MADPTHTQDVFQIRSLDVVHINPSIMEGEKLYTSLLGPDVAVLIERYAPVNLQLPVVTGPDKIPGILSCSQGAWDSSPSPVFYYQWTADGVDIPGENKQTIITYAELDSMEIGCTVTAVNFLGMVEVDSSNTILVGIIEPIWMEEFEHNVVTGLNQYEQQNLMNDDFNIISGMWVAPRVDMMTKVELILSGLWVENRHDIMGYSIYALQGIGHELKQSVPETNVFGLEKYVFNSFIGPDGSFESGVLTGFTTNNTSSDLNYQYKPSTDIKRSGQYSLKSPYGYPSSTIGYNRLIATIPIPESHWAEVDNYNKAFQSTYWATSLYPTHATYVGHDLIFLDEFGSHLPYPNPESTLFKPRKNVWDFFYTDLITIPVGTRSIQIDFKSRTNSQAYYVTYMDDIQFALYDAVH
jgi:hypothetical protein